MKIHLEIYVPPYEKGPHAKATFEPKEVDEPWTPRRLWADFSRTPHARKLKLRRWSCSARDVAHRGTKIDKGPKLEDGDVVKFFTQPRR